MLFNPLFIQSTGQTDASSSIKSSKLNGSSYLFSDIIKIIKENTIGETSAAPVAGNTTSADIAEIGANSSESIGQFFTLVEDNTSPDKINISLNDLLKNLLISSNSDQSKDVGQVDNSNKKSTASGKLTSALSKADAEKLIQNLAASLVQLNISPASLQQIQSLISNQDNSNLNKSLNNLSQSGNKIAELIINLSKSTKSADTSSDSTSNQTDELASLFTTISTLLANLSGAASSESSEITTTDDSKTDSSDQKISTEAEQLAAVLMNLYQNNNSLVINVNSGEDTIKIEVLGSAANSDQTSNTAGAVIPGTQEQQVANTSNTVPSSAPEKTPVNVQETTSDSSAAIAASIVSKAKESVSAAAEKEITKPQVTKAQAGSNNSDNNVTILSDQADNVNPVSKSNVNDISSLKSDDKVTITVSSKLNNAVSEDAGAKIVNETKTQAQAVKSDVSNVKVSVNAETADVKSTDVNNNPDAKKTVEIPVSTTNNSETEAAIKAYIKVSANDEVKASGNQEIKASDNKVAEKISVNPEADIKNSSKITRDIKNTVKESAQNIDTQSTEAATESNYTVSVKEAAKDSSSHAAQKANQINHAGAASPQSDTSSNELTDDTVSVKQSSNEDAAQAINKQGSFFNDQQQKKSSDGSKNSDNKAVEQITSDLSTKTTETVKEKFLNQTSSTDSPEKTIKITEITKEISSLIQQNTSKSVVLQLKPESLGKIKVTIDINNNIVNARVEVDTEAVKQIVQNNTAELRQSLSSNGMQLSSLSVNVSGGEQKPYQSFAQKKKSGYQTSEKRIEDNASLASAKSLGYNTYEYLI